MQLSFSDAIWARSFIDENSAGGGGVKIFSTSKNEKNPLSFYLSLNQNLNTSCHCECMFMEALLDLPMYYVFAQLCFHT